MKKNSDSLCEGMDHREIKVPSGTEQKLKTIMEKKFSSLEIFVGKEKLVLFASSAIIDEVESFMDTGIAEELNKNKEETSLTKE